MNSTHIASAGNEGQKIRSDCFIQLELTDQGGIQLELQSKVISMFGGSIKKQVSEIMAYYKIKNAHIKLFDKGALPWVISARLEAAIHQLIETNEQFLPDFIEENKTPSKRDRFRISRLYLPGNTPSMFLNAGLHKPDGIILDLEDAVAPLKKDEARLLVRNALRACSFYECERMVRINQGERGLEDLNFVIPHGVNVILIPKVENTTQITDVNTKIELLKKHYKITHSIFLMPIIESALGIEHAYEIATSAVNIVALAIGLEDYTADIGVKRTKMGSESLYARTRLVNACSAAKIQAIDSVFSDVGDMDGLENTVKESKSLGFTGMGCIHPRQVAVIKKGFAPESADIEKSIHIVKAANLAEKNGIGVVSIGTKMIDAPVVKRHKKNISLAIKLGLLDADWECK
ncbi:MAG: aldolase/citrate lyase family protein [Salinivirgaceae bacterium]|jgi:citrate lyase subunit beta/citryl-CoA lyase|nr:aldolase/citrate lyase family protein [Salinivirgaceae bacterium]